MDTLLTEEELMIRNAAREFLEAQCPPELARAMETDAVGYSADLWKQMAELGYLGLALPEQFGGQALPLGYLGLLFEEVGRAIAPVPLHSTVTAALAIAADGTEEQKQRILPPVIAGQMILTWAMLEKDPRYVPESIHAEAVADGNELVLRGEKKFVENFEAADLCLVVCRTGQGSTGSAGLSVLLVETKAPGVSATLLDTIAKDKQYNVTFDGVRVPKANVLGQVNEGWPVVQRMLERGTALLCAQLIGASRKATELATEYAKGRIAFGRPIGAFQSISHSLADMTIWNDGGALLTYEALWRMDQGLPAGIEVSQAKAFCNDKCMEAGRLANQIHGGIAFIKEFNLNLWFRRVASMTMRMGTSFEHRAHVASALIDKPGRVRLGESMYELGPVPAGPEPVAAG